MEIFLTLNDSQKKKKKGQRCVTLRNAGRAERAAFLVTFCFCFYNNSLFYYKKDFFLLLLFYFNMTSIGTGVSWLLLSF
jgi:hypothetical protein